MVIKNELYPIHFYGRVRGKCDGRLQNWPGIANGRPKFLAMSQMLPDISIWTSDHLPQGCVNAKEEKVLAVFGALYSLTRTSEGRRDLWSTEDGLFPAPRFGE